VTWAVLAVLAASIFHFGEFTIAHTMNISPGRRADTKSRAADLA
jgi:hypothetical protein